MTSQTTVQASCSSTVSSGPTADEHRDDAHEGDDKGSRSLAALGAVNRLEGRRHRLAK